MPPAVLDFSRDGDLVTPYKEPPDESRIQLVRFRKLISFEARPALNAIGFDGDFDVILIGIQVDDESSISYWTEPEDKSTDMVALQDSVRHADLSFEKQAYRNVDDRYALFHEFNNRDIRDELRSQAIEDTFAATSLGRDRTSFTGDRSIQTDTGDLYMVIHVDSAALKAVPSLAAVRNKRTSFTTSLVDAVIRQVFARARTLFNSQDVVIESRANELVRLAASRFVWHIFDRTGRGGIGNVHDTLSAISALPYEGRAGSGKIVIGNARNEHLNVAIKFRDEISLRNVEAARKLLEASGPDGHLLSDGEYIFGIGSVSQDYPVESESIFSVNILGRGRWEVCHSEEPLLAVRDGTPMLPNSPLDVQYFCEIVDRLLPGASISRLVELADAAGDNSHGAMLVISTDAAGEAERLHPQTSRVTPVEISPAMLVQLTAMDGGIIIDPQGRCHAVGVILDGRSCGGELSARGSRFNNAIRYVRSEAPDAVVVVYSADGKIDILPKLPYRIKKSFVDKVVEEYLALATPPSDTDAVVRSWEAVKRVRFYVSDDQCSRINRAKKDIEEWKRSQGMGILVEDDFVPNAMMNAGYWLPEE